MFPFKSVFYNDTYTMYAYESYMHQLNLYQSKVIREKMGLRVEDIGCFRDLIDLLNESKLMQNLKFKIDYLNKKILGSISATVNLIDFF